MFGKSCSLLAWLIIAGFCCSFVYDIFCLVFCVIKFFLGVGWAWCFGVGVWRGWFKVCEWAMRGSSNCIGIATSYLEPIRISMLKPIEGGYFRQPICRLLEVHCRNL